MAAPPSAADYLRDVKPVLRERCYACHGALKQKGGLRVDTARGLREAGGLVPVILPGSPDQSLLLSKLLHPDANERMPLEAAPLKPEQIAVIRAWIEAGAPVPPDEKGEDDPRDHWAFQRIARPEIPDTGKHPVDAFLAARQAEQGLQPRPEAERTILLRRLYLDLVGLPPTSAQLADSRPYPVIVEELLGSVEHAERWARHWMDIWRYAEWYGLGEQIRNSQKHLWHWRDWIVESLHADKGYDRMILEMLAGDELAPGDPDVVRATGFLARNYYLFNRTTWLDDTIEHTGKAFLGLTLNCAKCHDHKYDPIDQVDYYRLRAIFEPHQVRLDPVPGATNLDSNGMPRVFDDHLDAITSLHVRGDPSHPDPDTRITAGVPAFLARFASPVEPVTLPVFAWAPGSREHVRFGRMKEAREKAGMASRRLEEAREGGGDVRVAEAGLAVAEAELAHLGAILAADDAALVEYNPTLAKVASLREGEALKARAVLALLVAEQGTDDKQVRAAKADLNRAELKIAAADAAYTPLRASRKALETPAHTEESYPATYPRTSTGRRLMLARWITSPENPLAARVAVNHVWTRHFGEPLVESVFDFGRQAKRPDHAELLDWLSSEFIASGWSFRHLHRLLVTSESYRRTSSNAGADAATLAADPANRFLWRAHPRRMEAPVIRDSLLHLAGSLERQVGGPTVPPNVPSMRRSLYLWHSRDDRETFVSTFDDADVLQCYRRQESVMPQQALALANSRISLDAAGKIAGGLADTAAVTDRSRFIDSAFLLLLGRRPEDTERAECARYWQEMEGLESVRTGGDMEGLIRSRFVHVLLNHNDFVMIR